MLCSPSQQFFADKKNDDDLPRWKIKEKEEKKRKYKLGRWLRNSILSALYPNSLSSHHFASCFFIFS
ncbi:MAG: hypothetical protein L0H53_01175 [Candidatus Nitrosocosmicus sp.]|nr:hypothetical protein [Candidatus Nitrosocosmicus sp.]MDN5866196.1 hypothetical protein [Candidatus Nitrosocosmicus sp.]